MCNLVMGEGWLPPRQSQRGARDHQTDRPSLSRSSRPPHRGFGRHPVFDKRRNRHHAYRDRSYPPRRHQRVSDESTRNDDEPEEDGRWLSDAGSAKQLPDDDTPLLPEAEPRIETQPHAGDVKECADLTVASSAEPNPETVCSS